jgi:hypothetical protein
MASNGQARAPAQHSLDVLFANARHVRVLDGGERSWPEADVLFETEDPADIAALASCMKIAGHGFHCMCFGSQGIEVTIHTGARTTLGLHHGVSLRWGFWSSDASLAEPWRLCDWLARHGVTGPLEELESDVARTRQQRSAFQHWLDGMPKALEPMRERFVSAVRGAEPLAKLHEEALERLQKAHSTNREVVRALLAWAGRGRRNVHYECFPDDLLVKFPLETLLHAIDGADVSDEHLDGALRLFTKSWPFHSRRKAERAFIPATFVERLRARVPADEGRGFESLFSL